MQRFELVIKNEKLRSYRLIRIFILLANLGGMIWLLYQASIKSEMMWPGLALAGVVIALIFIYKSYDSIPRLAYVWCAIAWIRSPLWWLGVFMLALFFLDLAAHRKLIVRVSSDGIAYPSLADKKITWSELNNILLKDGLLTIDFRNNRLFQHFVDSDLSEKDFNDFCKKQLQASTMIK